MARRSIRTADLARQLRLVRVGRDDYTILVEASRDVPLKVGRIVRIRLERSGQPSWLWTITGPSEMGAGITLLGEAETFDAAKDAFTGAFADLVQWCDTDRGGLINWSI